MNYKIVKKVSSHSGKDIYKIYRKTLWFFWREVGLEVELARAERAVGYLKERDEWKRKAKKNSETVGYY